ncbi:MAG: lipocalin family protein [Flavobacteriales bacterium]|jgi:hypothetical protein|nr:lipocalin family protein [Flavobacteriales bacterium]
MRLTTTTLLTFLCAGTMFLAGCSKDDDPQPDSNNNGGLIVGGGDGGGGGGGGGQTTVQQLCDKNYKLTVSTISPAFQGTTDYLSLMEPCNTDDILRFSQDGTFTWDEGPSMCDPNGQQSVSGNWTLTNNNALLTLTAGGQSLAWNVVTINGTILKVTWQAQDQQGNSYTLTDTWTKQ